jgi:hypothetical protein
VANIITMKKLQPLNDGKEVTLPIKQKTDFIVVAIKISYTKKGKHIINITPVYEKEKPRRYKLNEINLN